MNDLITLYMGVCATHYAVCHYSSYLEARKLSLNSKSCPTRLILLLSSSDSVFQTEVSMWPVNYVSRIIMSSHFCQHTPLIPSMKSTCRLATPFFINSVMAEMHAAYYVSPTFEILVSHVTWTSTCIGTTCKV